jgi:hypothetical protein
MVLLVEDVLAVGTVAIKLTDRKDLAVERGDENGDAVGSRRG